jgi:radical SAM protein with 4Fe4S-binding SPASM domain
MITFNILSNGDVILCCENYSKKIILGNVEKSSIKEIWDSKKYQNIRNLIYKKKFEKIPPCVGCEKART